MKNNKVSFFQSTTQNNKHRNEKKIKNRIKRR